MGDFFVLAGDVKEVACNDTMTQQQTVELLFVFTDRLSAFLNAYEGPETPHSTRGIVKIFHITNPLVGPAIRAIYREHPGDNHYMSARLPELGADQLLRAVVDKASFHENGIVGDEEIAAVIYAAVLSEEEEMLG